MAIQIAMMSHKGLRRAVGAIGLAAIGFGLVDILVGAIPSGGLLVMAGGFFVLAYLWTAFLSWDARTAMRHTRTFP